MNIEQAQNMMTRIKLTTAEPYNQPAFVVGHAMVNKQMEFLPALEWVRDMLYEGVFFRYEGTWEDTLNVIRMYMGVSQ